MPNFMIKKGDTWPPLRGLATEGELTITGSMGADTITLPGHGYQSGDMITPTELNGGDPLVVGNLYFVVSPTLNSFKLALTSGGTAIDLTSDITVGKIKRLLPLASATGGIKVFLKSTSRRITGTVVVIHPPIEEGGQLFNWKYPWVAGDTTFVGEYEIELEITWDGVSSPPKKETIPNGRGPTVAIISDLG